MKYAIIAATALSTFAPIASAEYNSTIDYVLKNGAIYNIMGIGYSVVWSEDGTYVADGFSAIYNGKWRRDGDTFCIHPAGDPETCSVYPDGQGPGDSFEIISDLWGPVTVEIMSE